MKCDWKGCGEESAGLIIVRLHEHDDAHPQHPHTNEYRRELCATHTAAYVQFVRETPLHEEGALS